MRPRKGANMRYTISYEKEKISHMVIVEAASLQIAKAYFLSCHPDARVYGIRCTESYDMKPGIPVLAVMDEYGALRELLFRKTFNARKNIEKYGERSCLGSYAADVWHFMEPLLAEAGLAEEYDAWERRQQIRHDD